MADLILEYCFAGAGAGSSGGASTKAEDGPDAVGFVHSPLRESALKAISAMVDEDRSVARHLVNKKMDGDNFVVPGKFMARAKELRALTDEDDKAAASFEFDLLVKLAQQMHIRARKPATK